MEDAIITKLNLQPGMSIFGVFDGHGGKEIKYVGPEVSKFVEKFFVSELIKNEQYQMGYYDRALVETFRKMDDLLDSEFGNTELVKIRK
jgi:serine/threonine protein phosphatase PrpC